MISHLTIPMIHILQPCLFPPLPNFLTLPKYHFTPPPPLQDLIFTYLLTICPLQVLLQSPPLFLVHFLIIFKSQKINEKNVNKLFIYLNLFI